MKALVRLVMVLVVLGAIVIAGAAFTGIVQVPVVSSLVGMDKPRDLGGADADPVAFEAALAEHGLTLASPAENYTLGSAHTFSGSVPVDAVLSEAIINAMGEIANDSPAFKDVSVRFHDGSAETSAMIDLGGFGYPISGPVYLAWSVEVSGPRSVAVSLDTVELGRIGVPADFLAQAEDAINGYLATRLAAIDGLTIEAFDLQDGAVHFAGALPERYEAGVPAVGQLP